MKRSQKLSLYLIKIVPLLFLFLLVGSTFTLDLAKAADLTTVAPPCTFNGSISSRNSGRDHHSGINYGKADDLQMSECNNSYATLASISGYITKGMVAAADTSCPDIPYLKITSFDGDVSVMYLHGDYSMATNGAYIEAGQQVGITGTAGGCSTGNHIHFEVFKNSTKLSYAQWEYGDYATTSGFRTSYNFFDANTNTQGWTINNHLNYSSHADGGSIYAITGNDPILLSPRLNLFTSDFNTLSFTAAGNGGTNCGQVFFKIKQDANFSESKMFYFSLNTNGSDTNVTIDLSASSNWNPNPGVSKVTQLRIDPCGSTGGFRINNLTLSSTSTKVPVYRMWNSLNNNHILTANDSEKNSILKDFSRIIWAFENKQFYGLKLVNGACESAQNLAKPVYRFVKPSNSSYFYTISESVKDALLSDPNWTYEQIEFCAYQNAGLGLTPVYRFWNNTTQSHIFSANSTEITSLSSNPSWTNEGIVFYSFSL